MGELEAFFVANKGKVITKWSNYFEIYERYFSRFRNRKIYILEIGVFGGGSLVMWRNYFGPDVVIVGVDINPECKQYECENVHIEIGSQEDPVFLNSLKKKYPPFEIILDDGGHTMTQQKITFQTLFDHVAENGIFLTEDVFTSFWISYGGSGKYGKQRTFLEYSKQLIDRLYLHHVADYSIPQDYLSENLHAVHFYDGIVVFEKRKKIKSVSLRSGDSALLSKLFPTEECDDSPSPAYIEKASCLRVCLWWCKVFFHHITGNPHVRDQYREQLRHRRIRKANRPSAKNV